MEHRKDSNIDVSVVMAVFNEEENIEDAIESMMNQEYSNFEVIVINDGSKDSTERIVNSEYEEENKVSIFGQKNKGLPSSLNRAIKISNSEFIARLDADDRCLPGRIKKQVSFLRNNKEVGVVGTNYVRIDSIRNERHIRRYPEEDRIIRREMSKYIPIAHSSVMFRRRAAIEVGGYDESLSDHEDLDLWMRVAKNWKLANIPEPLVVRHIRSDSYWHRNFGAHARNAHLAKLNARAVAELSLPFYYYAFPIARLAYSWLPVPLKRITRRLVSDIEEQDLEESPQITPS